jgi:hypothetical protein
MLGRIEDVMNVVGHPGAATEAAVVAAVHTNK